MFQQWIKNLQLGNDDTSKPEKHWVERLTALLLIEIARSDTSVDKVELNTIKRALKDSCLSIDSDEIDQIVSSAVQDIETSVSLHEHTSQINKIFTREQKISLVEQMWRVAYADSDLDKYEESMIRRLCGLIHVGHQEYIQAKLRVTDS